MFWSWFIICYCVTLRSDRAEMFQGMLVPEFYYSLESCMVYVARNADLHTTNLLNLILFLTLFIEFPNVF